jgi:MoaA/NifB/PqqE/SkfB family radical SAM enzyme
MPRADIKLGYSCNDACVHCVVDDFRDLLREKRMRADKTTAQFKRELVESRARADTVVITGGEPTIRPDLLEILACARDLGYHIQMQSNGRRFGDPDFAEAVVDVARVDYCIALHGPGPEVHDLVTRRAGAWEETVRGIRNLVARRQAVTGKIVLSRLNHAHLPETVALFESMGVRHVSIAFPHALGTARKLWDTVVPRYREVVPYVHAALDFVSTHGMTADAETFPYCHMEGYERWISEIAQQLEAYVELRQYGSDAEILDWSTVRREIKRKFPQCRGCRFDAVCEGPWSEYAERFGGEEFTPLYGAAVSDPRSVLDGTFRRHFGVLDGLEAPVPAALAT